MLVPARSSSFILFSAVTSTYLSGEGVHVMELCVNKTTSVPKSILHYVLEKGHYFGPEISLYPLLYLNKKTVTHRVLVIL